METEKSMCCAFLGFWPPGLLPHLLTDFAPAHLPDGSSIPALHFDPPDVTSHWCLDSLTTTRTLPHILLGHLQCALTPSESCAVNAASSFVLATRLWAAWASGMDFLIPRAESKAAESALWSMMASLRSFSERSSELNLPENNVPSERYRSWCNYVLNFEIQSLSATDG